MPASYPAGFDTMSDPAANLSGPPLHSTMHNQINDVIEAIEAKLGLNPSGVATTVAAVVATTTWTAVTFTSLWVNYGGGNQDVQYRKVGDRVEIRGAMSTGTIGSSAFTLPVGFRPLTIVNRGTVSNSAFGAIVIAAAGTFTPFVGSNAWFQCDCWFSVTA
jgi:hypothetical protein